MISFFFLNSVSLSVMMPFNIASHSLYDKNLFQLEQNFIRLQSDLII